MKKLVVLAIVVILLVVSFSEAFAAPWNNPNGYWIYGINCASRGTFDVWVGNNHTNASFNSLGEVGIMKALYVDFGNGLQLVWKIPGDGVFKNTTYCTWVLDGMPMAGDVLIP